jgi:esterase/lipase
MKWFDRWFKKEVAERKPVLYCVHGFGMRRTAEYICLREYFEPLGYPVVTPELFDLSDESSNNALLWIQRAQDGLDALIEQNERIWLVGFSMGGVIAAHLASQNKVERLVLIAPAFEYLTLKSVLDKVEEVARYVIRKTEKPISDFMPLPDAFLNMFRETVALCKDSVSQVHCPVLILHGSLDMTIPVSSSKYAYVKIPHPEKLLIVLEGAPHRILDDPGLNHDALVIIEEFFKQNIVKESTRR